MQTHLRGRGMFRAVTGVKPDWVVLLVPTVVAIRTVNVSVSLLLLGLLTAATFIRKSEDNYKIQAGPLLLLFASCAIVGSRPTTYGPLITLLLIALLVFRLITTTDSRRIVASLIDGCGLYLVANVLCNLAGLQSSASSVRIGDLVEETGFVRIIFPLTWSINIPPNMAAIYIVGFVFLVRESGLRRRVLRTICLFAAVTVLVEAGARVPLAITAALLLAVLCFPLTTRWVAQTASIVAACSALVVPAIIVSIQAVIAPLMALAPGRDTQAKSITSLEGRDYIWDRSIHYWLEWVNDLPHILFGFGVDGQYSSGASLSYSDRLSSMIRHPEFQYTHNSFLQQVFDGGLVGWLLLALALLWASARLANRGRGFGHWGSIATIAMTALLLSGITEVSLAPGPAYDSFYVLLVLVGVACQANGRLTDVSATRTASTVPSAQYVAPPGPMPDVSVARS